jgi:hypothetical protein
MSDRTAIALLLAGSWGLALAHSAPNSFVRLDVSSQSVRAQVLVPESELAFAMPGEQGPDAFAKYLLRHVAVETPQGARWKITVREVRSQLYFDHAYLIAELECTPPAGAPSHEFVLIDDAVTHEVRNHVVVVTRDGSKHPLLGAMQYPASRLAVSELPLETK